MKRGAILINSFDETESYLYQPRRLKEEFDLLGANVTIAKNDRAEFSVGAKTDLPFDKPDFVVYLDKDKYLCRALENAGVKVFNSSRAIEVCDDKVFTYIALSQKGVPVPETVPAPLCYKSGKTRGDEFIDGVIDKLSLPLIVKQSFGSLGSGVFLAESKAEVKKYADALMRVPHCFQKFIAASRGRDVRVIVVGDKIIGAMERRAADGDFRSNVGAGGSAAPRELTDEEKSVALAAHTALGLEYSGIDLLTDENGKPVVCEVNSNAYFSAFERVTGINAAKAYAEHILSKV